jgi:hypothetical protein
MEPKMRIPADRLAPVSDLLFRNKVDSTAAAAAMSVGKMTLWTWLNRHGMKPVDARRLAVALDGFAERLMRCAQLLRELASSEAAPPPPEPTPAPEQHTPTIAVGAFRRVYE